MTMRLLAHLTLLLLTVVSSLFTPLVEASPCPGAIRTNVVNFRAQIHFVCLQPTTPPRLDVISYGPPSRLVQSIKVDERNPDKISSFVDDEANLRIILAVPNRVNGTSVYSIDQNGNRLPEIHTVSTQYVDQLNTWRLDLSLEWQLAIANQPAYEPGVLHGQPTSQRQPLPEFKPMISIYSWHATYFDRYQLIYLPQDGHVSKLEPMNINGQEFLIVAMDSIRADKDPTFGVDSLIYRLDFGSGELEWKEFQRLSTKFAHDVKPFTLTHRASFQRDYYIAVLGRIKVTRDLVRAGGRPINVTDEEDGLIIYKYLGDEFVKTHAYPAQDMTKLEAINYGQGDTFVIMALLSEKTRQVALLSFDGLNFQALPNPNMVPTRRPSSRQRRTMTNLQLFLVPPSNVDSRTVEENNETVAKRTLDDNNSNSNNNNNNDRLAAPMPMLSLSDPELFSADDFDVTNASSKIVYQIPTNEIVPSESKEKQTTDAGEDKSHTKREFVGADPKEELLSWCKSTINSVLLDNFDAISKQIQLLPRVDQNKPIELDGDLVIEDDLHVSNLLFVRQLGDRQQILVENNAPNFTHTFHEIQQVHQEIDQIKNRVDQILVDDGSEQNVFNQFLFDTLVVDCQQQPGPYDPRMPYFAYNRLSCPHVGDIRATLMNNRNISNIQRQALLTGRSMIIERDVRFEHLVLHGSVNITRTLNGIPINEIIFKKGFVGGPISGHKDFKNGLFSQSRLNVGNWRGTNLDRIEFFTSSGDQAITSMRVTQAIIDSSFNNQTSHIKRLNGLDLGQHLSQIALSGADNQFETPILFDELVLNGPIHMVGGLSRLSSIDLEELWSHTMFKQANQNISAPMDFAGSVEMSHGGNIVVNGPVNGFWLNPREILMQDRDYRLPNPIIFDGSLDVRSLQARRALNGIQVIFNPATRRQELALLYDEGDQQITGDKVFTSIHLGGRSAILGNINGHLNLSQLYSLANSFGQPHYFPRIKLTGNDIRIADRANIHISSTINGVPTSQLCSLALSTYNKTSATYRSLRFEQPINLKSLRCSTINGFTDLASTFLTKYGNQNVLGDLRLTNGAIFNTTLGIQSTLNGLNVGALSRAILRSMNETRTGHKDIHGDLVLEDLVTDRINELRLSNILLAKADSPQVLRAPVTFDHLDIENVLNVGGNLMVQSFNQLNVTDLMTNTLTYDTPQVILNHIELDTLQVLGNSNLQTPLVNGRNLKRLFSDAVLYDVGQQILAPKIFRGPVEFAERMYMRHRIDGLSFEDIRANLLLLSDDLIDGDLILNNDCTIQKVLEIQSRSINDIDLDVFIRNMIRDGQPLRVAANGSIRFKDVIAKDVVVGGTVQGLDLSREAIWRPKLPTQVQQSSPPIVAPAAPQLGQQQPAAAPWLQLLPLPLPPLPPPQSQIILPMPQQQQQQQQLSVAAPPQYNQLIIPQSDYEAISRARALAELSHTLNKELPINFYYEIVQKHPLLGPLMHHARDSLFLKGTGKAGEPCLQHGQTIAILSKGDQKPPFTQTSRIQDTSKPRSISSAANYLFILDEDPSVQVLVYLWDHKSSLYELQERLALDTNSSSTPTSVKAFMSADRACLAVIGSSGASIYCQPKLGTRFSERTSLATSSLIDLDVWPIGNTSQVFVATISHQETRQIGDLNVVIFDTTTKQVMKFASKVLIKPLKLHFFRGASATSTAPLAAPPRLAVSEAITSNDLDKASTRIFSVELSEIQEITDSEVHDIQSVALDDFVSLLFFRSAHTLSIYSPAPACPQTLALLHRIPTKGANKFLVFGDRLSHFVVLSRDCDERGGYSTLILKYTSRVVV